MEACFATMFEDVRHERSLILSLSLTCPGVMKQSKFTDHERNILKNFAVVNNIDRDCWKKIQPYIYLNGIL